MTQLETQVLEAFAKAPKEYAERKSNGEVWHCYYMENVEFPVQGRKLAGVLSSLEQKGAYRPERTDGVGFFGYVKQVPAGTCAG